MARPKGVEKDKDTVEKLTKDVDATILKVVEESSPSDKTTTVRGIYEGKKPKFGKEAHGQ